MLDQINKSYPSRVFQSALTHSKKILLLDSQRNQRLRLSAALNLITLLQAKNTLLQSTLWNHLSRHSERKLW